MDIRNNDEVIKSIKYFLAVDKEFNSWCQCYGTTFLKRRYKDQANKYLNFLDRKIADNAYPKLSFYRGLGKYFPISFSINKKFHRDEVECFIKKIEDNKSYLNELSNQFTNIFECEFYKLLCGYSEIEKAASILNKRNTTLYVRDAHALQDAEINTLEYTKFSLALTIAEPLLNYLNIPERLPELKQLERASILANELSLIIKDYPEVAKCEYGSLCYQNLTESLLKMSNFTKKDMELKKHNKGKWFRPKSALSEIKTKEQSKKAIQYFFEDIGIEYIKNFALDHTKKGRPSADIILNLIPSFIFSIDNEPDLRTIQRWLSSLDGDGRLIKEKSYLLPSELKDKLGKSYYVSRQTNRDNNF